MGDWIMNLNRLKSNLVNRDWSSKNTKNNIEMIKFIGNKIRRTKELLK